MALRLLVVLVCLCPLSRPSDGRLERVGRLLRDGEAWCLATHLGGDWLVTARHCVQPPGAVVDSLDRFALSIAGSARPLRAIVVRDTAPYESIAQLGETDIALVQVRLAGRSSEARSERDRRGPLATTIAGADGTPRMRPTRLVNRSSTHWYVSATTSPGDSGGPLWEGDRLVGIASWRSRRPTGPAAYVSLSTHRSWIQEALLERRTRF